MDTIMDLCFLCTKEYNCVLANESIVSQVEYLLPEITIINLGIPLRICSVCDEALYAFSKFKQSSVESSRRLEARIKGAQLHTGSPPVVDDSETSSAKLEMMEETSVKEEYVEQTPLDTQIHTNRTFLNPIVLLERISAEPHNQMHKARVSQNIQLHPDTNVDNIEEMSIKEEQIEETLQDRELYNDILKEECVSNSVNDDSDRQPEHNTEDESATLNTSDEDWKGNSTNSAEETDGNCFKNMQTNTKKITHKTKNQDELKKKIQEKTDYRCNVCTELFISKALLGQHMRKNHRRIKDLSCTVCKKIFILKYDLNKHMELHNGIKSFQCLICKKKFFDNQNLESHMESHFRKRKSNLISQKRIHSDVKFQCYICDTSFAQKSTLNCHMKTHSNQCRINTVAKVANSTSPALLEASGPIKK